MRHCLGSLGEAVLGCGVVGEAESRDESCRFRVLLPSLMKHWFSLESALSHLVVTDEALVSI